MAQHDYQLANQVGASTRADLNDVLAAIASTNLGADFPPKIYPGMLWLDTRSPETLRLRNAQNSDWLPVAVGAGFLPLTGGTINGNVAVAGIFSNPAFAAMRINHAGTSAPANIVVGMIWYDTTTTLGKLKVATTLNGDWLELPDLSSPTFLDYVTIYSAAGNAQLNLVGQSGERRRIVGNQPALRFDFYGPADQLTMCISDAGDMYLPVTGWIMGVIAGKQAALGFTPVRQYDGNVIHIGGYPAHLYINNVDQGEINTSTTTTFFNHGDIGSYGVMIATASVGYNALTPGTNLRYNSATVENPPGTWRNMEYTVPAGNGGVFQRQA